MPRLPPVPKSPQGFLRATLSPGVGYSVVTFDQSHSSSSATIWARPVSVPWPISERAMRITTVSSGLTTTQALTSGAFSSAVANGMRMPSVRLPAAAPTTKSRRFILGMKFMASSPRSSVGRSSVDAGAHLLIGAAAADIGDRLVDVGVGRLRLLLEERRHRHDHAALAVAALRNIVVDPRLLH